GKTRNVFTSWWPGLSKKFANKYDNLLSTVTFKAAADGSYESQLSCGKDGTSATTIVSDGAEGWASITWKWTPFDTSLPQSRFEFIRQGSEVRFTPTAGQETKPTTILFAAEDERPLPTDWAEECS